MRHVVLSATQLASLLPIFGQPHYVHLFLVAWNTYPSKWVCFKISTKFENFRSTNLKSNNKTNHSQLKCGIKHVTSTPFHTIQCESRDRGVSFLYVNSRPPHKKIMRKYIFDNPLLFSVIPFSSQASYSHYRCRWHIFSSESFGK